MAKGHDPHSSNPPPVGGKVKQISHMNRIKMAAVGVHMYTGLGILLAFTAAVALKYYHIQFFLISLWLAVIVDSTDGAMARYFDVGRVLPTFNGRRLDDLIDFLTYVFLPSLAMIEFDILPTALMWVAVLPMIASAYGFSQEIAKTSESYVGFPSYWNIVFVYLYVMEVPAKWAVLIVIILSILVFVPIRYIYPSRTPWMKRTTLVLSSIFGLFMGYVCLFPNTAWAREVTKISLFFPIYYVIISLWHHRRVMTSGEEEKK